MKTFVKYFRSRFALKLWSSMMVLIVIGTLVSWVVHVLLFEPNYIRAVARRIENSVEPHISEAGMLDWSNVDESLARISLSISGLVFLGDSGGEKIRAYSMGLPGLPDKPGSLEDKVSTESLSDDRYIGDSYEKVLAGERTRNVFKADGFGLILIMGVPVSFEGDPSVLLLVSRLTEFEAVQEINRRDLRRLSIVMVVSASLLALLFMRYFARPVQSIRNAVNRLAEGDLSAVPDVRRDDELGQLSESVEELAGTLQKVEVLRKELIANVSHELRGPLSLIMGYGEMVRDISWSSEKLRNEHLNLIIGEAERLSRIVDDILDYSQLQAGYIRPNLTSANLFEVVRSEVEFCRQVAAGYDIEISFESYSTDIPVELDPIKMIQVLRNLINNAINHTKDGDVVSVAIERREGMVVVFVENPGPVIPEEARELIWERYQRIQHQGGRREGSGIGLSIVSKILSVHGFDFGVDSSDGTNIFWFSIRE